MMRSKLIMKTVCNHYGVKLEEVLCDGRKQPYVLYRQVLQYFLCKQYGPTKAGRMTDRGHDTVIYARDVIKSFCWTTPEFDDEISDINNKISLIVNKVSKMNPLLGWLYVTFIL